MSRFSAAWALAIAILGLGADRALAQGALGGNVLFENDFDDGLHVDWRAALPEQWIQDGWLHTRASGPVRDSQAFVHPGDTSWTDYELTLRVDPLLTNNWEWSRVFFRSAALGTTGTPLNPPEPESTYMLTLWGPLGSGDRPGVQLTREANNLRTSLAENYLPGITSAGPMDVRVLAVGDHINVWVDDVPVIDVVDSQPLLTGGIGIGAIWEAEARFDEIVVTRVPEPAASWLAVCGALAACVGSMCRVGRRRRLRLSRLSAMVGCAAAMLVMAFGDSAEGQELLTMEYVDHWDGIIDGATTTFTHVDPPPTAALSYFDFSDAHGTAAIEIVLRDPYLVSGVTFDYAASGSPNTPIPGDGGGSASASASYLDLATAAWVAFFSDGAGGAGGASIGGTRQLTGLAFTTDRLRFETAAGASSIAGNPTVSMGVTVRSITGVPEPGGALLLAQLPQQSS